MTWETAAIVLAVVSALVAGGYIVRIKKEVGEAKSALDALITCLKLSMTDFTLTDAERISIVMSVADVEKEVGDVIALAKEIAAVIVNRGK